MIDRIVLDDPHRSDDPPLSESEYRRLVGEWFSLVPERIRLDLPAVIILAEAKIMKDLEAIPNG